MSLSDLIDDLSELPMLPIEITENSPHKMVRAIGTLAYIVLFFPLVALWFVIAAILIIPAMIQDS